MTTPIRIRLAAAIVVPILAAAGIALGASTAAATPPTGSVVDQSNEGSSPNSFYELENGQRRFAQTFTAGTSGMLTAVDVGINGLPYNGTSDPVTVQVMRTTSTGAPDEVALGSGTIPGDAVNVVTVAITPAVPVISGDRYAIMLSSPGFAEIALYIPANYTGGSWYTCYATCGTESFSMEFATYVDSSANVGPGVQGWPSGVVGVPYSFPFVTSGSPTPDVTLTGGALPPGIDLSRDGVLSGTPTTAGPYSITLTASNGVGGSTTLTGALDIRAPQAPAAPADVTAAGGDGSITVSFSPPPDTGDPAVTGYDLQYRVTGATTWIDDPTNVSSPVTLTGLANGTSYDLRVSAVNSVGAGAWSTPVSATPGTATPVGPATTGTLAATGVTVPVAPIGMAAIALLVAGAVLVATRRRHDQTQHRL